MNSDESMNFENSAINTIMHPSPAKKNFMSGISTKQAASVDGGKARFNTREHETVNITLTMGSSIKVTAKKVNADLKAHGTLPLSNEKQ